MLAQTSAPPKLKYLFVAELTDGTEIEQTPEDVSAMYDGLSPAQIENLHRELFPDMVSDLAATADRLHWPSSAISARLSKPMKSAYYDVVRRLADVKAFHLVLAEPDTENDEIYSVLFPSGMFGINGFPFSMYDGPPVHPQLFYCRRNQVDQHVNTVTGESAQGEHRIVGYRLGWTSVLPDGSPIERIMEVPA